MCENIQQNGQNDEAKNSGPLTTSHINGEKCNSALHPSKIDSNFYGSITFKCQ